ncbi:Hypothetical protein NTJ_08356 [Nesidiocoris tenuis]|uniref:Uncharacterized protein n=1 Tax=Nesidiocoris tenuis TaxID=355587 RepID=A0ABN7ATL2_9HEMI|nr:Hypothetical protein NTJ_08356 [Nesidiocoris tenuis]
MKHNNRGLPFTTLDYSSGRQMRGTHFARRPILRLDQVLHRSCRRGKFDEEKSTETGVTRAIDRSAPNGAQRRRRIGPRADRQLVARDSIGDRRDDLVKIDGRSRSHAVSNDLRESQIDWKT